MTRFALAICLVFISVSCVQSQTEEDIRKLELRQEVLAALGDFVDNRKKVLRGEYAFAAVNERYKIGLPGGPVLEPSIHLKIHARHNRPLYVASASCRPFHTSAYGHPIQNWNELLTSGQILAACTGPVDQTYSGLVDKPKGVTDKEFRRFGRLEFVFHLDPFDDIFEVAAEQQSRSETTNSVDRWLLRNSKRMTAEEGVGGQLISKWVLSNGKTYIRLVQEKKWDLMPTEFALYAPGGPSGDGPVQEIRIGWEKQKKLWLPKRIESISTEGVMRRLITVQSDYTLKWLVGNEVPEQWLDLEFRRQRDAMVKYFQIPADYFDQDLRKIIRRELTPEDFAAGFWAGNLDMSDSNER